MFDNKAREFQVPYMFFQVKENFNQTRNAVQAKELVYILRETRVKPFFSFFF